VTRSLPHVDCTHAGEHPPVRFVIEPIGPRSSRLEITLRPVELP
jgi:hypothetical protein